MVQEGICAAVGSWIHQNAKELAYKNPTGCAWVRENLASRLDLCEANWMNAIPNFVSITRADSQVGLILKVVAGIVLFTGVLMAFVSGSESMSGTLLILSVNFLAALGLFLLTKILVTRSEITEHEIKVETMKIFKATLPVAEVSQAFADPGLFTGGYGLRFISKGHRAYISGGEQVSIEMRDGRAYTLSVESAQSFLDALANVRAVH